jgi:hypothetical protein
VIFSYAGVWAALTAVNRTARRKNNNIFLVPSEVCIPFILNIPIKTRKGKNTNNNYL